MCESDDYLECQSVVVQSNTLGMLQQGEHCVSQVATSCDMCSVCWTQHPEHNELPRLIWWRCTVWNICIADGGFQQRFALHSWAASPLEPEKPSCSPRFSCYPKASSFSVGPPVCQFWLFAPVCACIPLGELVEHNPNAGIPTGDTCVSSLVSSLPVKRLYNTFFVLFFSGLSSSPDSYSIGSFETNK